MASQRDIARHRAIEEFRRLRVSPDLSVQCVDEIIQDVHTYGAHTTRSAWFTDGDLQLLEHDERVSRPLLMHAVDLAIAAAKLDKGV